MSSTEADAIERSDRPATVASLSSDLRRLGLDSGDLVIVHSSLSALGWVVGGAQAVAMALLETVGETGTVVVPTHTGHLTDPAQWSNPPVPEAWLDAIRDAMPLFDPAMTIPRQMGAVVECIRMHPDAIRSSHPVVSFAAVGPRAGEILEDHPLTPSLGEGSPLAKLYDLDAKVLLIGVGHANDTSIHLAEHRADFAGKTTRLEGVAALVDGRREWVTYHDVDIDTSDFDRIGEAIEQAGFESCGEVGAGTGRLARQRQIVDFAVAWMETNRTF